MTSRFRGLLAALLLPAFVLAGVGLAAVPAHAASLGPGYDYQGDPHSHLGGYRDPDGTVSYCIDAAKSSPFGGTTTDEGVFDRVHGRSDAVMLQLSYVLGHYGNTADDDVAAAVALVVWGLADPYDHEARGGDGFVITRAPAARRPIILALADRFRAEAAAWVRPDPGVAELRLSVDSADPEHGTLTVELAPGDATGSVTLTNAVFADTKRSTRDDVADGEQLWVRALPPPGTYEYEVSAAGAFTGTPYPDGSVHIWGTAGAQTLASSGRYVPGTFDAAAAVQVAIPRPPAPPQPLQPPLPRVAG